MEALMERVYAANMELFRRKMVLYTWGNVSEADRSAGIMVIKPSGVPYESMRPELMVTMSLEDGRVVSGKLRPSSDAPTHLALYRAFPDIGGVTHTHSTYATAWAQAGRAVPCLGTTHADYFHGDVPVTRFLTDREVLKEYELETGNIIAETFRGKRASHTPGVLVRGHGPYTWGKDAVESVHHAVVLEEIARMASITMSLASDIEVLPEAISQKHYSRKHGPSAYYGQR